MTQYGVVQKIEWQRHLSKSLERVKTDTLKVQMILSEPIPLFIHVDSRKIRANYEGQVKTCSVCNSEEHLKKNCPQARKRKAAEDYDNNFPILGTPRRVKQNPWLTVGRGGVTKESEAILGDLTTSTSNFREAESEIMILPALQPIHSQADALTEGITTKSKDIASIVGKGKSTNRPKKNSKKIRDKESRDLERCHSSENISNVSSLPFSDRAQRTQEELGEIQVAQNVISDPVVLARLISEVRNAPESLREQTSVNLLSPDHIEAGQRLNDRDEALLGASQASNVTQDMDFLETSLKTGRSDEGPSEQPSKKQVIDNNT